MDDFTVSTDPKVPMQGDPQAALKSILGQKWADPGEQKEAMGSVLSQMGYAPTGNPASVVGAPKTPVKSLQASADTATTETDKRLKEVMEKQGGVAKEYLGKKEELTKSRDEQLAAMGKPPEVNDMVAPTPMDLKELPNMFSAMMVIGALAGANVKGPLNASLNNMTGVLEGMHSGDQERMKREFQMFQQNHKTAQEKLKSYHEGIKNILSKSAGDSKSLTEEMNLKMMEMGIDPKMRDLYLNNPKLMFDLQDKVAKSEVQLKKAEASMSYMELRMKQQEKLIEGGKPTLTPETIDQLANRYALGDPDALKNIPRGMAGKPDMMAVMNRAAEIMTNQGISPGDNLARKAEVRALGESLKNITKNADAVGVVQKKLISHGELAVELAEKYGGDTAFPMLNRFELESKRATGDPGAAELLAQLDIFQKEFARLTMPNSNAQLHEGARSDAEKVLNSGFTLGQLKEIVGLLNKDAELSHKAFEKQVDDIKGRIAKKPAGSKPAEKSAEPPPGFTKI